MRFYWGGAAGEVWFPCLGKERRGSWSPLSRGVPSSFGLKRGAIPSGRKTRFPCALAGGERERPVPLIKCETGSPHALLWRVIKGPARRVSAQGWGPVSPAPGEG